MASKGRGDPEMTEAFRAMRDLAGSTVHILQHMENNTRNEEDTRYPGLIEFRKINPPQFKGGYNPEGAEFWIQELEKIFEVMLCTDGQKVAYAVFMLKEEAENWWCNAKRFLENERVEITWEVFRTKFLEKYFPENLKHKKEMEFLQLRQGSMSVGEYAAQFEKLAKYSTYYQMHPDERWKCRKFEEGLRLEIKKAVGPMEIRNFSLLVNKCEIIEGYGDDKPKNKKSKNSRLYNLKGKRVVGKNKPRFQRPQGQKLPQHVREVKQKPALRLRCGKCGRAHNVRVCVAKATLCFNCGKLGHFARDCVQSRETGVWIRPNQS